MTPSHPNKPSADTIATQRVPRKASPEARGVILFFHRYIGLFMAVFLLLTGMTGALLVWEQELDVALNPEILLNQSDQPHQSPDELLAQLKQQYPEVSFGFTLFHRDQRRTAVIYVSNWQHPKGYLIDQIFVDRASGEVLGGRNSFSPSPVSRREIIPWIMKFHWSLTLSWGAKLLGIVALLWLLDCFIAWYLTLPRRRFSWQKWKPSWKIKPKRMNYDLHRALSLWLLPVFLVLALSGIYFNLGHEVFKPVLNSFTETTPKPYEESYLGEADYNPDIDFTQGLAIARTVLAKHNVTEAGVAYLSYNANRGYYQFGFYSTDPIARDTTGVQVYLKSNGEFLQIYQVGEGTAGDIITDWQFALHSGQAFGLLGRLIIFMAGIAISIISITGIIIWWRKLNARRSSQSKANVSVNNRLSATHRDQSPSLGTIESNDSSNAQIQ